MTLRTIDLQVILPRMDKAARYQDQGRQQSHLRHQFALQEQRQHSEKTHQVPLLNRGEGGRLLTQGEMDKRKSRSFKLKRRRPARDDHEEEQDPHRGKKLDLRV